MGAFLSLLNENYPPKSKFSIDDIPDLKGQIVLVTGANTGALFTALPSPVVVTNHRQITFAVTGIGKETAKVRGVALPVLAIDCLKYNQALLSHNAKVYVASRDASKAATAIEELKATTGKDDVHFLRLDLSDLKSVKEAAQEFMRYVCYCAPCGLL